VPPVYEEKTTSDRSLNEKQAPQQLHKTRGSTVLQIHDTYHTKIVAMDGNRLAQLSTIKMISLRIMLSSCSWCNCHFVLQTIKTAAAPQLED